MRLSWKPDHHCWNLAILQRPKHLLAARGRRRAKIRLALNQHQGCRDLGHVSNRRTSLEIRFLFPRSALEPHRRKEREVGGIPEAAPIRDVALRNGGLKALRLTDDPIRQ